MTGKAVIEVGSRPNFPYPKTRMKIDLGDPLIQARLHGGKPRTSKSGKILQRKPDKAFKQELADLTEEGKETGEALGRLAKKKVPEPMVFSEYASYGKGGLNPKDAGNLARYLMRIEKQQGVKWFDPHQGNVAYRGAGGKKRHPAIFDFGTATKSSRPTTMTLPGVGRIMAARPSADPKFQYFLEQAGLQKFLRQMQKTKT
jgi:hypothetical protein